ncbi:MAG TPA: thiamine pyrophosphate-dependent enzyme [Acidimicrobiales bacterium]|nr:thiamine pyrophosphate-dependent enzyme [Acidimicrobiales bacterium]
MSNTTVQVSVTVRDMLRADWLPTTWCPGCGLGIVMNAIVQAVRHRGLSKDRCTMVSGIGCTGRMSGYVDMNTLHTTHGRATAFATGIKLAQPDMTVITVMGDGDAMAIGGNHLVHAMRRNIGMVAVVVNNNVYGLTGGQSSPTTPIGGHSTTAASGSFERPMNLELLAATAGAALYARATVFHTAPLVKTLESALAVDGFALVEVLSNCHTIYGRMNGTPEAADMMLPMDAATWRTTPVLERRGLRPVRVTRATTTIGPALADGGAVHRDPWERRGVVWQRAGSRDLSHLLHDELEGGQRWP